MLSKLLNSFLAVLLSAGFLLVLAVLAWWFKRSSGIAFQDVLFWVGAAPIVLFTLGSMGRLAGRGDAAYQLSRSVSDATPEKKAGARIDDLKSQGKSSLNWILAGLLLWLGSWGISYFTRL